MKKFTRRDAVSSSLLAAGALVAGGTVAAAQTQTPAAIDPAASSATPAGVIVSFAGTSAKVPAGWHECDGSTLDRTVFVSLFNAIGTLYGGSGNPDFNLPDYRGYFLRGTSPNASVDPSGPRAVGSTQSHALQQHTHSFNGAFLQAQGGGGFQGSGFAGNSGNNPGFQGPYGSNGLNSGTAATETRPVNIAVTYLIKL